MLFVHLKNFNTQYTQKRWQPVTHSLHIVGRNLKIINYATTGETIRIKRKLLLELFNAI